MLPVGGRAGPGRRVRRGTLRGYPINGAYQLRLDDKAGSLEADKHADPTVLAQNLFGVSPEQIHSVPVKLTMMDGRITHDTR